MATDKGPLVLGISWFLTILVVVTIALRISTRVNVLKAIGADDYIMIVAGVLQVISQGFLTLTVRYGLGKHLADLTNPAVAIPEIIKANWESQTPGILASIVARISIAVLLLRLFNRKEWFRWYIYVVTAAQTLVECLLIIVIWAQCKPVEALWNQAIPHKCWNPKIETDIAYLGQAIFTLSDLTFVLIPVIIVYNLNMSWRNKFGLIIVLSLGLFTMVASIMKLLGVQGTSESKDPTYDTTTPLLWATVEQSLVIIMGNIPPLRAFPRHEFSYVRSLGSGLNRLTSWRSRTSASRGSHVHSSPPYPASKGSGSGYEELELGSREQFVPGTDTAGADSTAKMPFPPPIVRHNKGGGTERILGHDASVIQRNDTYTVSYDRSGLPKEDV
ncbi:hypothetical protein MMC25_005472 [Agyrium rufum]|nr:hypothetical protein [Agyrium rufum]